MTVFVVKMMDTNCNITIDKIFQKRQDAELYVELNSKRGDFAYFVSEYPVFTTYDSASEISGRVIAAGECCI